MIQLAGDTFILASSTSWLENMSPCRRVDRSLAPAAAASLAAVADDAPTDLFSLVHLSLCQHLDLYGSSVLQSLTEERDSAILDFSMQPDGCLEVQATAL